MDGLCELTARMHNRRSNIPKAYDIPEPDYETEEVVDITPETVLQSPTYAMESNEDVNFDSDENTGSLSPQQIRAMMSKEQKELQRDLKIMQKRGMEFQSKRPEFKAKHHEIMSRGIQRKEVKESQESELSTKLRSRSEQIEQAENAKKVEDEKPEFMKVHLKKGKGGPKT